MSPRDSEAERFVAVPKLDGFTVLRLLRRTEDVDIFLCRQHSPVLEVAIELPRGAGSSRGATPESTTRPPAKAKGRRRAEKEGFLRTGTTADGRPFVVRNLDEQETRLIRPETDLPEQTVTTELVTGPRTIVKLIDGDTGEMGHSTEFSERHPPQSASAVTVGKTDDQAGQADEAVRQPDPKIGDEDRPARRSAPSESTGRKDGIDDVEGSDETLTEVERARKRWIRVFAAAAAVLVVGIVAWQLVDRAIERREAAAEQREAAAMRRSDAAWLAQKVLTVDGVTYTRDQLHKGVQGYTAGKATTASQTPRQQRDLATKIAMNHRDRLVLQDLDPTRPSPALNAPAGTGWGRNVTDQNLEDEIDAILTDRVEGEAKQEYERRKDTTYSIWCLDATGQGNSVSRAAVLADTASRVRRGEDFDAASIAAWGARGVERQARATDFGCETKSRWRDRDLPTAVIDQLAAAPLGTVIGPIDVPIEGFFTWNDPDGVAKNGGASGLFRLRSKYLTYEQVRSEIVPGLVEKKKTELQTEALVRLRVDVDPSLGVWRPNGPTGRIERTAG